MNTRQLLAILALACFPALFFAPEASAKKSKTKVAAGLKEALSVGTGRAVEILGAVDGYLGNAEVRIQPPKKLKKLSKILRKIGQDELVEEFETSMNRAAEAAAPIAKQVFLDAIKEIRFNDAHAILTGDNHSATRYLEEKSRAQLTELFKPIISEQLDSVGATKAFNSLMDQTAEIPFMGKPAVDLEGHVTGAALDGLFHMIGKQEEQIRTKGVARTSALLKEVFGKNASDSGTKKRWWEKY